MLAAQPVLHANAGSVVQFMNHPRNPLKRREDSCFKTYSPILSGTGAGRPAACAASNAA